MVLSSRSHTPRSTAKAVRDIRPEVQMNGKHDKEKGVNVQVIVRCRSVKFLLKHIYVTKFGLFLCYELDLQEQIQ